MKKLISFKKIATIAGAMCAYWMGSGFATGQEILQFFTVNGLKGVLATIIFLFITGISTYFICGVGQREQFENPFDIFEYYCGKWLGAFYTWFSIIVMYCALIVILAGATLHEFYDLQTHIGIIIIGLLALGTAVLGVERLIQIVGMIGPVQILFVLVLGGGGNHFLGKRSRQSFRKR